MNNPEFITFTGVDNDTDPHEMVVLSDQYPIEWGILFSPKRQGVEARYPAISTVKWLVEELPLHFSAHLCGGDARDVIEGGASRHDDLIRHYFERSQINTADPKVQPPLIEAWGFRLNVRAILQCRGAFPAISATDILYDASGGRGISPSDWPFAVNTTFCGYAGGLNPGNVAAAVAVIKQKAQSYWIDMESGVRDENDRFDLGKCRAVCEAVYGAPHD